MEDKLQRLLRRPEVEKATGLKKTALAEAIERGEVPRPIMATESGKAQRWLESEIAAHQRARIAARDRKAK
jgi:predicted DNA-binding transcriptional regulator AlpA